MYVMCVYDGVGDVGVMGSAVVVGVVIAVGVVVVVLIFWYCCDNKLCCLW